MNRRWTANSGHITLCAIPGDARLFCAQINSWFATSAGTYVDSQAESTIFRKSLASSRLSTQWIPPSNVEKPLANLDLRSGLCWTCLSEYMTSAVFDQCRDVNFRRGWCGSRASLAVPEELPATSTPTLNPLGTCT